MPRVTLRAIPEEHFKQKQGKLYPRTPHGTAVSAVFFALLPLSGFLVLEGVVDYSSLWDQGSLWNQGK